MAPKPQPQIQRYMAAVDCTQRNLEGKHVFLKKGQPYTPMGPEEEISNHLNPVDDRGNEIEVEFEIPRPVKKAAELPKVGEGMAPGASVDIEALKAVIREELKAELTKEIAADILREMEAQKKAAAKAVAKAEGQQ